MSCKTGSSCSCAPSGKMISASGEPGIDAGRRWFMKAGAAFTTVALSPTVTLMAFGGSEANAAQESLNPNARWGLLIDVSKCPDGCSECVTACRVENGWQDTGHPETDAQWIRKLTVRDPKTGGTTELPMMCQHCAEPPCADVCPTGASFKRADGIVLVDKHLCIGCRYCMMACPYKARSFIHEDLEDQKPHAPRGKGTVESCTMCVHRIDAGGIPACVETCNAKAGKAMMFGNLNDPQSDIAKRVAELVNSQIRADLGLDPGVHYTGM